MANAWLIGDSDVFRYVIKRELKDHGVKIGKLKGNPRTHSGSRTIQDKSVLSPVFGVALTNLPCCKELQTGLEVPRFVKECVEFLSGHLDEEGLFRKSGSHARQKDLQAMLGRGEPIPSDCQVADVASILKRFFRDLPEPIIHPRYQAWIRKCVSMEDEILQEWTALLVLCFLPMRNLQLLRFFMLFLARVALNSQKNKMDSKNLALVLMPTILCGGGDAGHLGKTAQFERQLKQQTLIIEILINNAKDIGIVPEYILDRMVKSKNRSNEALDNLTSEDELERSSDDNLENNFLNKRKKRKSGTFHGIVNGLGQVGHKVGGLLKSSGSLDNLDKTPENLTNMETPRTFRSSKRKASDDIGTFFSATKRKAILRNMTEEPLPLPHSKRAVNLYKSALSSPMTPLQSTKPALGEIDALNSEGKMVFHFDTPSIKFADDSFSGFSSTPSTSSTTEPIPAGVTPRRNKLKKLNPLKSRRFKRLSLGAIGGGSSKSDTPLKLPQRQNNRYHSNYVIPEGNVGHRLANPPNPGGLDTMHFVPRHPECREIANSVAAAGQSYKEVSSAMYTPPSYLLKDAAGKEIAAEVKAEPEEKSRNQSSIEAKHLREKASYSEEEETECLLRSYYSEGYDNLTYNKIHRHRTRTQSCLSMCLSSSTLEDDSMLLGEEYSPKSTITSKRGDSMTDGNLTAQQSHISLELNKGTGSCFSVGAEAEKHLVITNTTEVTELSSEKCDVEDDTNSMEVETIIETQSEPTFSFRYKMLRDLGSLRSTPSESKTALWILKKTISLDSGRGESIEDLELPTQERYSRWISNEGEERMDDHHFLKPASQGINKYSIEAYSDPHTLQGAKVAKVNPSRLRPLKVDHDGSSMKRFHIMQKRLHLDPTKKECKTTVKQKIKLFNSLSEEDLSYLEKDGSSRLMNHHSGADQKSEVKIMSLPRLVKSVSYDSGLKELSTEMPSTSILQCEVLTKMSSKSSDEDSFEAAMNSANKALSNFKRFAAESSTPRANRKPLGDKNSWEVNQVRSSPKALVPDHVDPLLQRSPAFLSKGAQSPTYRKQLKRLNTEESPNWQRRSPRAKFRDDSYMHLLKSPRSHHGSPRNPLLDYDKKGSRSRHVRKEWHV